MEHAQNVVLPALLASRLRCATFGFDIFISIFVFVFVFIFIFVFVFVFVFIVLLSVGALLYESPRRKPG